MTNRPIVRFANPTRSGIQSHILANNNFATITAFQRRNFATFMRNFTAEKGPKSQTFASAAPHHSFLRFQRRFQSSYSSATSGAENNSQYNLFARYIRFCNEQQMAAAIATSFVLWSLGDILTQKLESIAASQNEDPNTKKPTTLPPSFSSSFSFLNMKRLAATAFFGVSIAGIGGFYWYRLLDKAVSQWLRITPANSGYARFTAAKLGLEFLIWHPISLALFWLYLGVLAEGKSLSTIGRQWVTDLPTAIAADMCLWLPIDIINFRFMPVHLQVIVVNIGSLFEAVLLSYLHGASGGHGHSPSGGEHNDAYRHTHHGRTQTYTSTQVLAQGSSPAQAFLPSTKPATSASSGVGNMIALLNQDDNSIDKVHWL